MAEDEFKVAEKPIESSKPLKNPKWEIFCLNYISNGYNASKAYADAGYEPHRPSAIRLLTKANVENRINHLKAEKLEKLGFDAERFLESLLEQYHADLSDIMDDSGNVLPIKQWPEVWRKYCSNLEVTSVGDTEAFVTKVKAMDKARIAEMIGKHVSIAAFNEKKTIDNISSDGSMTPKTLDDFYKINNAPKSES